MNAHEHSPPPLLEVKELTIGFGTTPTVRGVSFTLSPAEILGIVGESGSGKSVTCRALMGLLPGSACVTGQVRFDGREMLDLDEKEWNTLRGRDMAMIFQNPASHLDPLRRIGAQIASPMRRHLGLGRREALARATGLLGDVGIREPDLRARSYPHEFSGGMKQRAMIAAAIGCGPKLLIADEPTTALDVTVQARILKLLKDINRKHGLAIILISHDLGVVADICSRVAVMRQGEIVEQGPVDEIINRPRHPYTRLLIDSQPSHRRMSPVREAQSEELLSVEGLSVSFPVRRDGVGRLAPRRSFLALDGIDLHVRPAETVGIVGESGSGKSTLALSLMHQNQPSGGLIRYAGQDIHALDRSGLTRYRRQVQMVFQNPYDSLNPRMTITDTVAEPIWRHGLADRKTARAQAEELLDQVELPAHLHNRKPRQLSGGQCQRVGLARALALQPRLLICDEITSALDVTTQAQILDLLMRLQRERELALLYISHDLAVVGNLCQRLYVFKDGKVVEEGPARQVLARPEAPYTRELIASFNPLAPVDAPAHMAGT
jgi:peptide/nickel transport system ATP-binding protein